MTKYLPEGGDRKINNSYNDVYESFTTKTMKER